MDCGCNINSEEICPNCGSLSNYVYVNNNYTNNTVKEVSILQELTTFKLSDNLKIDITSRYHEITAEKTKRNAPRRAMIYCCISEICKNKGIPFDKDEYRSVLNIKQRDINMALKDMKASVGVGNLSTSIRDVLKHLISSLNMKESCLGEIMEIHDKCKRNSPLFNSSKIETLAAGLVYYYLKTNLEDFNIESYFDNSKVSKDTILAVNDDIIKYLTY